jgi:hypothetical protein
MSTYAELTARLQDTVENSFTADQLAFFFQQAEQRLYQAVQIPALRKNQTASLTEDNKYLSLPSDFLYVYSLAVVDGSGAYSYLLDKDVNYIREAYPTPTSTGLPKFYAIFDKDTLILGPTPDDDYTVEMHYGYYPESIVTAGTTWLSENYDSALFNAALLEAARFLKFEQDVVALYEKMFAASLAQLKVFGDGKLRQDSYRSGQPRVQVT